MQRPRVRYRLSGGTPRNRPTEGGYHRDDNWLSGAAGTLRWAVGGHPMTYGDVLLASDGSDASEAALEHALQFDTTHSQP